MADLDINDPFGIVDKRKGRGNTTSTHHLAEAANMTTIAGMKARLTTLNPTTYTAARLSTMTENDLLYALRVASADAAGI
jgi:hypothetical protein